jgi:hypothetical protein
MLLLSDTIIIQQKAIKKYDFYAEFYVNLAFSIAF